MRGFAGGVITAVSLLVSMPVQADVDLYKGKTAGVSAALELGAYFGRINNANFGSGVNDFRTFEKGKTNIDVFEAYAEPTLKGWVGLDWGKLYGRFSALLLRLQVWMVMRAVSHAAKSRKSNPKRWYLAGNRVRYYPVSAQTPSTYHSGHRNSRSVISS